MTSIAMRTRAYTAKQLAAAPCAHCGKASCEQWNMQPCAIGKKVWFPLCRRCDINLNAEILRYANIPGRTKLIRDYRTRRSNS